MNVRVRGVKIRFGDGRIQGRERTYPFQRLYTITSITGTSNRGCATAPLQRNIRTNNTVVHHCLYINAQM